jgi:hypothetical protein
MGSGANPRTKLTESELADKMEKMRVLSAEKARKFEQAERDEREHAQAYARGMEEARKRRQVEAERRRQGDEDRRRMEDERARNRERKLRAIGTKEGGWDEGKQADEDDGPRDFRGANGGVRGVRSLGGGGGLSSSRYAQTVADDDDAAAGAGGDGRFRGRGRGRGGPRGRGGRGGGFGSSDRIGFDADTSVNTHANGAGARPTKHTAGKPGLGSEDFPALPSSGVKKTDDGPAPPPPKVEIPTKLASQILAATSPLSPPVGDWGDEMNALDAKMAEAAAKSAKS